MMRLGPGFWYLPHGFHSSDKEFKDNVYWQTITLHLLWVLLKCWMRSRKFKSEKPTSALTIKAED